MPFIPAIVGGIGSAVAGAAAGAAGLIGGAASAVGSAASGLLSGATGLAGGAVKAIAGGISALTGGQAAGQAAVPVMAGGEMGSLAAVSEAAALGIPAAATASTGLASLTEAVGKGVGIYGTLAQIEIAKDLTEAQKIAAQKSLIQAEAIKIQKETKDTKAPIPTLAAGPTYITPATTPDPNYTLYIALAIFALFILRKK